MASSCCCGCAAISSSLLLPNLPKKPLFLLNVPNPSPTLTLTLVPSKSLKPSRFFRTAAITARGGGGKEQKLVTEGLVIEALPNCLFKVRLENEGELIGYLSGKMQQRKIMILPGDKVEIEINRYDPDRGRITYRLGNRPRKDAASK